MIYNIEYKPISQNDIYGNPIDLRNLTSMLHEPIYEPIYEVIDSGYQKKYNLNNKSDSKQENTKDTKSQTSNNVVSKQKKHSKSKSINITNRDGWDAAWSEFGAQFGLTDKDYLYLLAQLEVESDNFKSFEEYSSGEQYEGNEGLGNTQAGDGIKFKGRGAIQVTGRYNYETIYNQFFVPNGLSEYNIIEHPELGKDPYIGSLMAIGWLAVTQNGKKAIDAIKKNNVLEITKAINGGTNGLKLRESKTLNLLKKYKFI